MLGRARCIRCNSVIEFQSCHSQPNGGTEFIGGGVYGSRVTDDSNRYAIYVCDNCAESLIKFRPEIISVFKEEKKTTYKRIPVKKEIV